MSGCSHKGFWLKMCQKCADTKPYMVFRTGAKGGYFWGEGHPDESMRGEPVEWPKRQYPDYIHLVKNEPPPEESERTPAEAALDLMTYLNLRSQAQVKEAFDICFQECMQVAKDTKNIWVALVAQNCAIAIAHKKEKLCGL